MNHLQGFGLFVLIGVAVGVCGGVERVLRKRAQVRRAVAVNARVVEVQSDSTLEPGDVTWYYPVVTFVVDGKLVRAKLAAGTSKLGQYRAGGRLRVYYDPRDPTQIAAKAGGFPGGVLATLLGLVFVGIGVGCCWAGLSR